ncbi:UNVERIFIED_CONTAM: Actin-related protein 8 [Sesamum calycinum]|uniref:Actin-related protein 8 n=1 Tax=Sesamum calycinum TaxID=2727403 RepID=A0AAW2Q5B4_9LAMI
MTSLIRKVWVSVITRSGSSSASPHMSNPNPLSDHDRFLQMMYIHFSYREFDRIPIDIFMQILKILGPRESARIRAVCKAWKFLVSDNRLWIYFLQNQPEPWDSVFFAETHLRSGYPLQVFPSQMHDLSFMHIYGQREEVPGALIIDGGSGIVNMGGANIPLHLGGLRHFWNLETSSLQCLLDLDISFQQFATVVSLVGQICSVAHMLMFSVGLCYHNKPDTESAKSSRRQLKDAIYSTLFDMNVPAVCAINQNLCYVALDYEAELSKDTQASFAVTSNNWFTLSKERFQTGEILFQPRIAGMQAMGLHQAVALCMDHCHDAELTGDDNWYKTVVLTGGTACLPGLAARLEKELYGLLPPSIASGIRVFPPPYGTDSAWYGAKLVSNVISAVVDKSFVYVGIISVRPAKK